MRAFKKQKTTTGNSDGSTASMTTTSTTTTTTTSTTPTTPTSSSTPKTIATPVPIHPTTIIANSNQRLGSRSDMNANVPISVHLQNQLLQLHTIPSPDINAMNSMPPQNMSLGDTSLFYNAPALYASYYSTQPIRPPSLAQKFNNVPAPVPASMLDSVPPIPSCLTVCSCNV